MAAGVLALVGAVVLTVAYVALSERFPYATVHRRQLDVWATVASLACLGVILYGAADAHRTTRARRVEALNADAAARQIVYRLHSPDLRGGLRSDVDTHLDQPAPEIGPDDPAEGAVPAEPREASAPSGGDGSTDTSSDGGSISDGEDPGRFVVAPTADRAPIVVPIVDDPPDPRPTATRTPDPIGIATRRNVPADTPTLPPTYVAPTNETIRQATPTPHCGEPEDIRLRVERLDTSLDRSGGDLVVSYRARIRNESPFPATMADVMITALNHDAGSEQFGHATRPDVALVSGAVITLDGALTLIKMPPPFGSTDLCISFVGESCGRRPPYRVTRRCSTVRGF